jgi:hypothetical protein
MKAAIRSVPALLALVVTLTACGVGPGPNLAGPDGASYLSAYSGEWTLLRLESDDLDAQLREAMSARSGGAAGGMAGPGGRGGAGGRSGGGGRAGGGGRPGGMPGAAGARDPEGMRQAMQATQILGRTPGNFTLNLSPESATLIQGNAASVTLTFGGEETAVPLGDTEYFVAAEWTSEGLIIERKVDGGGGVKDKMRVNEDGLLVVERQIDTGRNGKVKGTLRYQKN